ncbi:FtsQ-type POTRA domain-containing protein, partial [Candidatus Dojkabacteria bacterium]|nr:FtsQ-type POTRA domain-containing protein [Candidatus Dojkabacteria bacterium]
MDEIKIYEKFLGRKNNRDTSRKSLLRRILILAVFVVALFGAYFALFQSSFTQINNVTVKAIRSDSKLSDNETILVEDSVLKVASGKNIFLMPISEIEDAAYHASPYVQEVSVHKSFPRKLVLKISRREEAISIASYSNCVVLDKFGYTLEYEKKDLAEDVSIEKIQKACSAFVKKYNLPVLYVKSLKAEFKLGKESTFYDISKFVQLI